MDKNKILSPLVCGFGAAVFAAVPGIKSVSCCLIIPGAGILAVYLYQRTAGFTEKIPIERAFFIGLMTGIFSAVFATGIDLIITMITKSNEFIEALPYTESMMRDFNLGPLIEDTMNLLKQIETDIRTTGFSLMYAFLMLFSNGIINTIFGILGGLLGMVIMNKRISS